MRWRWFLLVCVACGRVGFAPASGDDEAGSGSDWAPPSCAESCEASSYCGTPVGSCGGEGTCRLKPFTCPAELGFVCGCDGTTYENQCEAEKAGVSVAAYGQCVVSTCEPACGATEYCATPDGMCDAVGTCMPRPADGDLCGGSPVCGCNGVNYASSCDAAKQGINVRMSGTCDPS